MSPSAASAVRVLPLRNAEMRIEIIIEYLITSFANDLQFAYFYTRLCAHGPKNTGWIFSSPWITISNLFNKLKYLIKYLIISKHKHKQIQIRPKQGRIGRAFGCPRRP